MLEIIKYQLKARKNTMLLLGSIIVAVNFIAYTIEGFSLAREFYTFPSIGVFWLPMAIGVTLISSLVLFFQCSSGHVDDLLYKDTNYLMLTIPRHGWEVLGGRLIAGLIEYSIFCIGGFLLLSIHVAFGGALSSKGEMQFFEILAFVYQQVMVVNFFSFIQINLFMLCAFISTGVFLTFATVASRSFIKNKGVATAIAVAVFITLTNISVQFGTSLSKKFDWFTRISFTVDSKLVSASQWGQGGLQQGPFFSPMNELTVPLAPFVFFILLAALLFAGASWLMEKKVEL